MERQFLTPEDVAEDTGLSVEEARELVKQMIKQLRNAGYVTVEGRIQRKHYEKQKEAGFMVARKEIEREDPVRLDEKRLLSMGEFCTYASIGREKGMRLAESAAAVFRAGKRVMIDRVKFDQWCDENSCISEEE